MRAHFLARQFLYLPGKTVLLRIAQFAGAGDLRLRQSEPRIQFFLQLLHDARQEPRAPVIDQHSQEIAHVRLNAFVVHNRVQQFMLLIRRDGRIFPDPPQVRALRNQPGNHTQPSDRPIRIQMLVEHDIGKGSCVNAGDGGHGLVVVLSQVIGSGAELSGEVAHQRLIGRGINLNLFLR